MIARVGAHREQMCLSRGTQLCLAPGKQLCLPQEKQLCLPQEKQLCPPQGEQLCLSRGMLHVWSVDLDACTPSYRHVLSLEELERAEQIVDERRRARWSAARAFLRALLSAYLKADPASLQFALERSGKPMLAASIHEDLRFSLSHSGPIALCALTRSYAVGCDVQLPSHNASLPALAPRVFGKQRAEQLCSLPPSIRNQELLYAWTELEAERKLSGAGMSYLSQHTSGASVWLERLELARGCVATVTRALPPTEMQLLSWHW